MVCGLAGVVLLNVGGLVEWASVLLLKRNGGDWWGVGMGFDQLAGNCSNEPQNKHEHLVPA